MAAARLELLVAGRVQGVGFRAWTRARAVELALAGSARNLADGRVAIVAEGPRAACEALLRAVTGDQAPGRVTDVVRSWGEATGEADGFRVG